MKNKKDVQMKKFTRNKKIKNIGSQNFKNKCNTYDKLKSQIDKDYPIKSNKYIMFLGVIMFLGGIFLIFLGDIIKNTYLVAGGVFLSFVTIVYLLFN